MQAFTFILIVVLAVIISGPLQKLVRVPLPILQIAIGAALAWPVQGIHVEFEPELFLLLFIPPLLFADAWQAPKREFWHMRWPIASMAFGLVFFTILTFGYALHWMVPAVPLSVAFALAAVLSPTDAVAVSSIVEKGSVPAPLMHLLEGESLFNDASGLVMFRFATAAALTGSFSLFDASLAFVYAVLVGFAAGIALLYLAVRGLKLLSWIGEVAAETQMLVLLVLPFGAYLLAEHLGASGVLAAVAAGLFLGRAGAFAHFNVSARMLNVGVWTAMSFAFNGAIFVILGVQLPTIIRAVPAELVTRHWLVQPIATVIALTLCLIALRYAWISMSLIVRHWVAKLRGRLVIHVGGRIKLAGSIAGVRGAITLAAVLSLPLAMPDGTPFPARDLSIFLAAGVIICSLAIASLLLPAVSKGLASTAEDKIQLEERRARILAAEAAIAKLESIAAGEDTQGVATPRSAAADALVLQYRQRIAALESGQFVDVDGNQRDQKMEVDLRKTAMDAEAAALRQCLRTGAINDTTLRKIMTEATLTEALLHMKSKR